MSAIIKHLAIEDMFKHMKAGKIVEYIFHILTITILFLEIHSHFPPESVIRLEVEQQSEETSSIYSLIGSSSDQNYSLEYVKIYLLDSQVKLKEAKFEYQHYKSIDLKEQKIEKFRTFLVSRKSLQTEFGKEGFHFAFLSEDNHFKFNFSIEGENEPQFECQTVAIKAGISGQLVKEVIPCEIGESLLFYHKIPIWKMMIFVMLTFKQYAI